MHLTRLFASVLLGHQLASAALPANLCPDAVIIQPVVVVDQSPVLVNGFFPHDTSLLINGIAVPITNAPISLSTVITGSSSSAATLTRYEYCQAPGANCHVNTLIPAVRDHRPLHTPP